MRRPSASTAAAVSSHELSIPSTTIQPVPPNSAPGAENTKGGGPSPTAFALRRLPSRRLRRGRGLRLRRARLRTLLVDQSHRLYHVQGALQLHVLLLGLHRVGGRQRPILCSGPRCGLPHEFL